MRESNSLLLDVSPAHAIFFLANITYLLALLLSRSRTVTYVFRRRPLGLRTKTGFVSKTRTCDGGPKSRKLGGPLCFLHVILAPSWSPYLCFLAFQSVPLFPESQCLVSQLTRCYILCLTCNIISTHLVLLSHYCLHYNEIN